MTSDGRRLVRLFALNIAGPFVAGFLFVIFIVVVSRA